MTATVIPLRKKPHKPNRKPRGRRQPSILELAHREADLAGSTQDLSAFPVLDMLCWLAKVASPRARSVTWGGKRFVLKHGLWNRVVVCPRTGRRLVGTVDL
ncbi:hypothetical protein [Propionivibrio sp.]|uniref:hypothetical protein n=1 Tax=Propionivibrio sp. TaxID=2212460 RepID=UPI00272DF246|nr:hypothetical protein [Propionivibrio sp.]